MILLNSKYMQKQIALLTICLCLTIQASTQPISRFSKSIYFDEQIREFESPAWAPDVLIHINAPSANKMDPKSKNLLIFYATPNGSTIEQTIGNTDSIAINWRYGIQHIGAQTRFLRTKIKNANVVVCYLQTKQKSWGTWRKSHHDSLIAQMVDTLRLMLGPNTSVVLNGHSGGGNFVFGFINAHCKIPAFIERIAFIDSNYAYDEKLKHGEKMANWLKRSKKNALCILAYNDSIALLDGKPFVSPTGGTWNKSKEMAAYFEKMFNLANRHDSAFINMLALNSRLQIILKKNPAREILHTVQVERNGFIHSILSGTMLEEKDYAYFPVSYPFKAYENFIQQGHTFAGAQFPERKKTSLPFSEFYHRIEKLPFSEREYKILEQLKTGNFPDFMREFVTIEYQYDHHIIQVQVMPDYLSIGTNSDFCRMPISPQTAQSFADYTGTMLPTPLLVDTIRKYASYRLEPETFYPEGNKNESLAQFVRHHRSIEKQWQEQYPNASREKILDGIKKDVVICNRISNLPNKVAIYGWYRPDGSRIQPLYTGHANWYVDYSHGIRLVNRLVYIDGKPAWLDKLLADPLFFKMFSYETEPMKISRYPGIN
jgi:hypothetical protein